MSANDSITQFQEFCDSHDCETCEYLRFKDRGERYACAIAWMEKNAVSANNETELKPCPFCGGEACLVWCRGHLHKVECEGCHTTTAQYISPQEAVAAWNERAES